MQTRHVVALNLVTAAASIATAFLLETAAINAADKAGSHGADVLSWSLNLLPAAAAGALWYGAVGLLTAARAEATIRWLARMGAVAGLCAALLGAVAFTIASTDFWLFAQIIIWPAMALVSGMLVEQVVWTRRRPNRPQSGAA